MASSERALSRWSPASENVLLAYLALAKLLMHLLTNGNYGYFRDEFYYIAAGERLDLGYVEFPPFVAIVADVSRFLLGDSPVALRFFPALAGALVVVLAGLMARELGGGRFAQGLAALATLVAPNFLAMGTFLSMDAFDQLFWVSATYVLLLILKRDRPWLGGAIGFAFLLPYAFWQIEHGWPTLEFWGNYGGKVDPASPVEFLVEQIVTMHPLTLLIWLAGLYYYLFSSAGQPYRPLGWIYVVLSVLFVVQNAKFYFLAPAYPMLFAAGGLTIERFVRRHRWGWLKPAYVVILLVGGTVAAPLVAVPALPVQTLAKITGAAGGDAGVEVETREVGQLPQQFADRFGWETMVATVAGVYRDLPPEER